MLYANGCSMTFGDELGPVGDPICNSRAWPQHLGNLLHQSVVNEATPGGSNDRIVRKTTNFLANYLNYHPADTLCVAIGWTLPIRREFHDAEINHWYNFIPSDAKSAGQLTPVYCPAFCSEEESVERFFAQMLSMQGLLQHLNITYVFFTAIWDRKPWSAAYQRLIDRSRYYLPDIHFHAWVYINNYPIGPLGHPLDAAHIAWAQALYQAMFQ